MRTFLPVAVLLGLAACSSSDQDQTEPLQSETITPTEAAQTLSPPRREEFAAAWAEACPDAEQVGTALCRSKGITDPGFTCNFGLGDDEYRRHTAELEPAGDTWALADPDNACSVE